MYGDSKMNSMMGTCEVNAGDSAVGSRAPGLFIQHEVLNKRIEENNILVSRLCERLGAVTRPSGPRSEGIDPKKHGEPLSPAAEALCQSGERLATTNRALEYLLTDLDL